MERGVRHVLTRRLIFFGCVVGIGAALLGLSSCVLFNKLPIAGFTIGPSTTGSAPFTVTLSAAPSTDPDGEIETYAWDFGDGAAGTGKTVPHTYSTVGTFTIILTVTDQSGGTDQAAKTVYVTAPEPAGPSASFTVNPTSGTSPVNVTVDASASTYPGGTITAYEWTFGDGGTGFGVVTSHTYFSGTSRTYTITLLIRASDGKTGTATKTVTVNAPGGGGGTPVAGAPSAVFDILFENPAVVGDDYTNETVAPVRVWLDPSDSEADEGRSIVTYAWSFGDGSADSSVASPTVQEHVYVTNLSSKVFSVTLVVIDDEGAIDSVTKTVKAENYQPVAGFEVSDEDNVKVDTQPNADGEWWTGEEDGEEDGLVTYMGVPNGTRTVWVRSHVIEDGDYLGMDRDDPTPNGKSEEPTPEFNDDDDPNMSFDREGQTWEAGGKPTWFPNRAWGIQTLKIEWGDYTTDYIPYVDGADTLASHDYEFAGVVKNWTIKVTAIDFLGNEKSLSRTITMNAG